jgi:hypothetical protein
MRRNLATKRAKRARRLYFNSSFNRSLQFQARVVNPADSFPAVKNLSAVFQIFEYDIERLVHHFGWQLLFQLLPVHKIVRTS